MYAVRFEAVVSRNHTRRVRAFTKEGRAEWHYDCASSRGGIRDGVTIQWEYDAAAEMLEVECVRAPFWIDRATIHRRLSHEIESELESERAA